MLVAAQDAPPLRDDDVQRIVETAAHRLVRLLQQRGVLDEAVGDALAEKEPLLAALSAASIQGQLATEPRAGHWVRRLLSGPLGAFLCMRPRVSRPKTGRGWSGSVAT